MISDSLNTTEPMVLTRSKRNDFLVEIRKSKSSLLIKQKRVKMYGNIDNSQILVSENDNPNSILQQNAQIEPLISKERQEQLTNLKIKFLDYLYQEKWNEIAEVVKSLKDAICDEEDCVPIGEVLKLELTSHMLYFLNESFANRKKLQIETAWLLANITAGTTQHIDCIIEAGCLPAFIKCFNLANEEIHENIMWALANIAGEDKPQYRNALLELGILDEVVRQLCRPAKRNLYVRTAVWLISNLLKGPPYPAFNDVSKCLPVLAHCVPMVDKLTQEYSLKCLHHLTKNYDKEAFKEIASYGFIPKILKALPNSDDNIALVILQIIGNLAYGSPDSTQSLFGRQILQILTKFLESRNKLLRWESCYILSNILAEEPEEKDSTIIYQIMPIVKHRISDVCYDVKLEATCCIFNFASRYPLEQVQILSSYGIIEGLLQNLSLEDAKLTKNSLLTLQVILGHGERFRANFHGDNPFVTQIYQRNGHCLFEELQRHSDIQVFKIVEKIIEDYFHSEEI